MNEPASSAPSAELSIIPQPDSIVAHEGYFDFNRNTKIIAADSSGEKAGGALNVLLNERYEFKLAVTEDKTSPNTITFALDQSQEAKAEGYSLKIEPGSIQITGTERGMYYGSQSLLQLFPANFNGETKIPSADIRDTPRFSYRGMHLDVARHFMRVEFVKKFIRLISRYKYNYFHWHLTDDQGWRIEIKKYPLLTSIGSRRPETVLEKHYPQVYLPPDPYVPYVGDQIPVEGYYTQEEIRDIVEYARARYVTIIPEIEMPGHASAAVASYPEYGCRQGYRPKVQTTWGVFPDNFCPTEPTIKFIENVLSEVIDLFPDSPYIHIGGDEVLRLDYWRSSSIVKEVMQANSLSNWKAVQSWFLKRVEQFVNSKKKKIIGWDEMMDAGMPPNATVMAWRMKGDRGVTWNPGAEAARRKHDVIMTPNHFYYFDHPQADPALEPLSIYKEMIVLAQVYNFEPIPAGLSPKDEDHIIGGEGTLWTEFMKEPRDVEYMMFPRAIALAEVLWSKPENKSLADFQKRLNRELPNLNRERVYYKGSLAPPTQFYSPDVPVPVRPAVRLRQVPENQVLSAPSLGGRALPYRILLPPDYKTSNRSYAVLYLLHGLTENENTWWDKTSLAQYAAKYDLIIVTPGAGDSWYANSVSDPGAHYEDVIISDLIPYIEAHYRTIAERDGRAIAGNSMGGLGAIKFALRYPQMFAFAGSMSGTLDVPRSAGLIFGDENNSVRRDNNIFLLLDQAVRKREVLPWLYVSIGKSDPNSLVTASNRRFERDLRQKVSGFEYNERPGAHDWRLWGEDIFMMLGRMSVFMKMSR